MVSGVVHALSCGDVGFVSLMTCVLVVWWVLLFASPGPTLCRVHIRGKLVFVVMCWLLVGRGLLLNHRFGGLVKRQDADSR